MILPDLQLPVRLDITLFDIFLQLNSCERELDEPRCEKTGLRGFRPGLTQTGLYSQRRWLEA